MALSRGTSRFLCICVLSGCGTDSKSRTVQQRTVPYSTSLCSTIAQYSKTYFLITLLNNLTKRHIKTRRYLAAATTTTAGDEVTNMPAAALAATPGFRYRYPLQELPSPVLTPWDCAGSQMSGSGTHGPPVQRMRGPRGCVHASSPTPARQSRRHRLLL
jgi:hypothetical protein